MSSPEHDALTGDSNGLDSAGDDKTKDSIVSQESQNSSSRISDNPMEPHDGVLDFEEDGPEPQDTKEDSEDADSRSPSRSASSTGAPQAVVTTEANDEVSKDTDAVDGDQVEEGENSVDSRDDQNEPTIEKNNKKKKRDSDLEDGEVTDSEEEDEEAEERQASPSKNDKDKPAICRFFSRGQCTWGSQCRFIHPGMPGPGGGPAGGPMPGPPPPYGGPLPHGPPPRMFGGPGAMGIGPHFPPVPIAPVESAWERGLRNAKEMLKEANRRREEDPAFEDRKLHQGLQASPVRELSPPRVSPSPSPPLRSKMYGTYERHREFARSLSPPNLDRLRQERYPAVERDQRGRAGPGDMWRDPWMRSKSPMRGRQRRRSRSWSSRSSSSSSGSSYSSSRSSSYSRSRSRDRRREYGGGSRGGPSVGRGPRGGGRQRYPSERTGRLMASPSPTRYRGRDPNPGAAVGGRPRRRSSSSSSISSRSPSPRRRRYSRSKTPEGIPRRPRQVSPLGRPVGTQIKMNLLDKSKKLPVKRPFSASPSRSPSMSPKKLRVSPSPPPPPPPKPIEKEIKEKKKDRDKKSDAAKRDELMRQLKAVEDAIAKKKAKT